MATAYFDWSTLCDAYKARRGLAGTAGGAYLDLHALVEEIAAADGLCVSHAHAQELLIWEPFDNARDMGDWLDSLGPRWIRSVDPQHDHEVRWWLASELGEAQGPYNPIVPGALEAYPSAATPLPPHTAAIMSITRQNSLGALVRGGHRHTSISWFRSQSVGHFAKLHADRTEHPIVSGHDPRTIDRLLYSVLRQRMEPLVPTFVGVSQADILAAVERVWRRPDSIPVARVMSRVVHEVGATIADQTATSKRFGRQYSSMGYDVQHLSGAAYCDLFTCDYRIDVAIGDFRVSRGMLPQVSVRGAGGPAPFVAELRRQWNEANQRAGQISDRG
jgi:hypothetical protein